MADDGFDPNAGGIGGGSEVEANDPSPPVENAEPGVVEVVAGDLVFEVEQEEEPPTPAFIIVPDGYGRGTRPRITLPDGTPLGVWLDMPERRNLLGNQVRELLLQMGLDKPNANWFGNMRDKRIKGQGARSPAMQALAAAEEKHERQTSAVRQAFIEAQKKKEKK